MINHIYQLISPKVFSVKYDDIGGNGKVIVRPSYLAVCHADQRYYLGQRDHKVLAKKLPMALIHEGCAVVLDDPSGTFRRGQKVVMIPNAPARKDDIIYENYAEGSHFLSSGYDGFMREMVDLSADRLVAYEHIPDKLAAITEFVSVAVHAATRFSLAAHARREVITVWGDGSLSYTVCCVLKKLFKSSKINVVGRDMRKLSHFSFVDKTYISDELPADYTTDHAFECCGGEGSYYAIDDIIRTIHPQGCVMLMGVSENRVGINTRDILEKGLTFIGSSRSGRSDFEKAISFMEQPSFQNRLSVIVWEDKPVKNIEDINRVMANDLTTPFKTVFKWTV